MKKVFLAFLAVLFMATGCQKIGNDLEKGTYVGSLSRYGLMTVEIINDGKCLMQVGDGEQREGFFRIVDNGEVAFTGFVHTSKNHFSSSDHIISFSAADIGHGKILSRTSFSAEYDVDYKGERHYVSFTKK